MEQIGGMAYGNGDEDERLVQAAQRIAEGKRVVALQQVLITRLKASGLRTVGAEPAFVRSLAIFEDDLHRLQNKRQRKATGTPMAHEQPSSDVDQRLKDESPS